MKSTAWKRIRSLKPTLLALSHEIHGYAEIAFEEHRSSNAIANELSDLGFHVEAGVCAIDTAFVARYGSGSVTIGICAEYDALPGIGHACGHNIIAAAAVGAAAGLTEIADDLDLTIRVLGTPAEEGGGGKILMLERGAFDGLALAIMVHPAPSDALSMICLAAQNLDVTFEGRSAHAAAHPELGINAADAMTVSQVAIGLLRQHIRPTDRIHGVVTHAGGAPNVIPDRATGRWVSRAATLDELSGLTPRVMRCFEAGALATGSSVRIEEGLAYAQIEVDRRLAALYQTNALELGRTVPELGCEPEPLVGSTDMGNVSLVVPSVHPLIGIDAGGAVNHQPDFAAACASPSADRAVIDGAMAMAGTVIDAVSPNTSS